MSDTLVDVALPVPGRGVLTYRVGESLTARAVEGRRAVVPIGARKAVGLVVAVHHHAPREHRPLREVLEIADEPPLLTEGILELVRWAADYYLCPLGEMVRVSVPGGLSLRVGRRVRLTADGELAAGSLLPDAAGSEPPRVRMLRALSASGEKGLLRSSLLSRGGAGSASALERLLEEGLLSIAEESVRPAPVRLPRETESRVARGEGPPPERTNELVATAGGGTAATPRHEPNAAQRAALDALLAAFETETPAPFLLHGVTGSGKTEVYLAAIEASLRRGRAALYLVPEIGLTALLARQIRARFGPLVAVLHSALPEGERRREWNRILRGEARIALGPRSAVFAPAHPLGLVIVDEEQDPSYKQEDSPRYNGRDLALVRARMEGAVAVLGTATPSLETWRNVQRGKYRRIELPERVAGRSMPRIEVVDLREEFRETGETAVLSRRLIAALRERLDRGEQAIVLINRRGYAPFILCRSCGTTVKCSACAVSMTWHRKDELLRCHYCGATRRVPALCPSCLSEHLQPVGEGTERAEKHLLRELPGVRLVRMDSDTVRGRRAHEKLLGAFERREYDVLLGTQMVAKGHDFPGVTLVGVLLADAGLGLPDFRAAERTFQLLTQVTGRSGRGATPGEVVIQAVHPGHYAIAAAVAQDRQAFYDREMRIRRALRYPPFTCLAHVVARHSKLERARAVAKRFAESVRLHGEGRVEIMGPAPAPIPRLQRRHRIQLFARSVSRRRLGAVLAEAMRDAEAGAYARDLVVDVDPMSVL